MLKIAPLVIGLPDGELALDGECVVELPTSAVSPCSPEREAAFLSSRELERDLPCTTFAEASIVADEPIWVSGILRLDDGGEGGYRDLRGSPALSVQPGFPAPGHPSTTTRFIVTQGRRPSVPMQSERTAQAGRADLVTAL